MLQATIIVSHACCRRSGGAHPFNQVVESIHIIMNMLKIFRFLVHAPLGIYIGVFLLSSFLLQVPFIFSDWYADEDFQNPMVDSLEEGGKTLVLYYSVIFAPLIETFVVQFSVIKLFRLITKKAILTLAIAVPLSAILFSLLHTYSPYYMMITFFMGYSMGVAFFIGMYRKDWPAFMLVVMIHSAWNLLVFILHEIGG